LISNVQSFQFDWQSLAVVAPLLKIEPSVLFLCAGSGDPGEVTLTTQEQLKVSHLQQTSVVLTASVSMSQATLEPMIDSSQVLYISGDVDPAVFPGWIAQTSVGIMCERVELCQILGISDSFTSIAWSELRPLNATHDVLDGAAQLTAIAVNTQSVSVLLPPFSPDLRVLAVAGLNDLEVILAVAEAGAEGVTAPFTIPGRRVMLPTGRPGCDFAVSDPGYLTIIDNAVDWASGEGDDAPLDLHVMLVANNAPWPDDRARDRLFLLQSLGCRVDVVPPDLTSAQYDAALAGVDAVWICDTVDPASSASILSQKSVGAVIEYKDWLSRMAL